MPFVLHEDASVWSWFSGFFLALIRKCCFITKLRQTVVAFDFIAFSVFFIYAFDLLSKKEKLSKPCGRTVWPALKEEGCSSRERTSKRSPVFVSRERRGQGHGPAGGGGSFYFIESCLEAGGLVAEVKFAAHANQIG